jgi:RNA polymerase-associated protein
VRIVLAEKNISVDIRYVDNNNPPEDLLNLNPYNTLPTLIDRELVLYQPGIITEYLDERFPHPPLLPVYPIARASCRQMIYRIEKDWLSLVDTIQVGDTKKAEVARKTLYNQLVSLEPVFAENPFFLSEEFSLADCCLAPMLWRLTSLKIELPASAKAIHLYKKRIFLRESFKSSLSDQERELRG